MKEITKVIVPIDFLRHTEQLTELALYVCKKFEATLRFVHIVEHPHNFSSYETPSLAQFTTEVLDKAEIKMEQFVKRNSEILPNCEGKVIQGNIVTSIVNYAKDEQADLIIIGTHGRKGLEKLWLGSIAERVIKNSPCPTLTCNPYK